MSLGRIRVDWAGIATGPGISTFFAAATAPGATLDLAPLRTFFNSAIGSYLPTGVSLNFPVVGDVINESTGLIEGTWGAPAQSIVSGAIAGSYSAASGAVVSWRTTGIVNGHRVRGRTFLVPMSNAAYDATGTLATNFRDQVLAAAATLIGNAGLKLAIWHRPVAGVGGAGFQIAAATMTDKAMVLTSRRD
jgi:hypothetical protein